MMIKYTIAVAIVLIVTAFTARPAQVLFSG
jgi:hypothetical protein